MTDNDDECIIYEQNQYWISIDMLHENDPILSRFISVPKEMSSLNCMAFVAGK